MEYRPAVKKKGSYFGAPRSGGPQKGLRRGSRTVHLDTTINNDGAVICTTCGTATPPKIKHNLGYYIFYEMYPLFLTIHFYEL